MNSLRFMTNLKEKVIKQKLLEILESSACYRKDFFRHVNLIND